MQDKKIVLLAGEWDTTPIVYNFLRENFGVAAAIIEGKVPRKEFLKKRAKKLGWLNVLGQMAFQATIARALSLASKERIREIGEEYHLKSLAIPPGQIINVSSVNSDDCLQHLIALQPDLVIVHGTRIISKKILTGVKASFINIHAGITPRYRGSHGAYWALYNGDEENCGVTVHLVDAGIDTGSILYQQKIPFTKADNFSTYSLLQLAIGLQLLQKAIGDFFSSSLQVKSNKLDSALWHHPTLWGYLWKRFTKGVK